MSTHYKTLHERGGRKSLVQAMSRLPTEGSCRTSHICIRLPDDGTVRVRNLVHRGAPRPVTKVPSLTLDRIVQCESVLEADLAWILDACPGVTAFAEQAAALRYRHDNDLRWHVPDFAVWTDEGLEFVEVKFASDVCPEIRARTTRLQGLLSPYQIGYRLVMETEIRGGAALGNAHKLLVRGRVHPSDIWTTQACDEVRRRGGVPLSEFSWSVSESEAAAGIARLIIDGHLRLDMSADISASTQVYHGQALIQENRLWLPVAFK
jgi:hypothetical protein